MKKVIVLAILAFASVAYGYSVDDFKNDVETCNNTLSEERETAPACVRIFTYSNKECDKGSNFHCGELGRCYLYWKGH